MRRETTEQSFNTADQDNNQEKEGVDQRSSEEQIKEFSDQLHTMKDSPVPFTKETVNNPITGKTELIIKGPNSNDVVALATASPLLEPFVVIDESNKSARQIPVEADFETTLNRAAQELNKGSRVEKEELVHRWLDEFYSILNESDDYDMQYMEGNQELDENNVGAQVSTVRIIGPSKNIIREYADPILIHTINDMRIVGIDPIDRVQVNKYFKKSPSNHTA